MFLRPRLWSAGPGSAALVLAAAAFAVGLGLGSNIGPVTAGRSATVPAPAALAPPATSQVQSDAVRMAHPAEVLRVIDAPELKARCDEERFKAEAAREALRAILDQGEVGISHVTLDKYGGRVVADASTRATPNVSDALLVSGHARRYGGGHRDGWCG